MPTFLHPLLLWGLAIVAAPVLIHLINLLRHRRVDWAAMEFLRVSRKKHRTWVLLKQWLLLLLRMLAIAAIVLIVARPLWKRQWGGLFGERKTHHIVLLDDSYSMSDRWADTSAFARAKRVVERIGAEAARQGQAEFTLLRFSRAAYSPLPLGEGPGVRAEFSEKSPSSSPHPNPLPKGEGVQPDFLREPADNGFREKLDAVLRKIDVSQSGAGPAETLVTLNEVLGQLEDRRRILYLISDFRTRQWNDPAEVKKLLGRWQAAGAEIHLVNCVDRARPNLTLASLAPETGIRAAGVGWFMGVAVTNNGAAPARNVTVFLEEDGRRRPSVQLAEIPSERTARTRFYATFSAPGWHRITARLESDAVEADNQWFFAFRLPSDLPVLLIDGDLRAPDARFLKWLFASEGLARTGLRPEIELPRILDRKPLAEYAAVNLANVDRLDTAAVQALENYVREGGGAAFFLGEPCETGFYNRQLYRNGRGLFPLPLRGPAELIVDRLEVAPDVQTGEHFLFRNFAKSRNNFLQSVNVQRYFASADGWEPPADGSVRVLARLRNGDPLIVEKRFGRGRVVAMLSSLAPTWNDWATNPGGAIVLLDLQGYLSQGRTRDVPRQVGSPLEVVLDPARYRPQVTFVVPRSPRSTKMTTIPVDAVASKGGKLSAVLPDAGRSGYYEAQLKEIGGGEETQLYAYNVDPAEGNLAVVDQPGLAQRLQGLNYRYAPAGLFQTNDRAVQGDRLWELILYLLIALLIGEQLLAWSASYHPRSVGQVGNLSHISPGGAP